MPTVSEIIEIAQVSQYLSANAIRRGGLYSSGIDKRLPRLLYMVRKTVELRYEQDSSDDTLPKTSSYLYALCGKFSLEAQRLLNIGGGGSVSPITPSTTDDDIYPIRITADDLDEDGNYNNPSIVGDNLIVFANDVNQKWWVAGEGFEYTTTGIRITMAYDETYAWIIEKLGTGTSTTVAVPSVTDYNLTENDTLIENIAATTEGQLITIAIVPNGFTYTFDTNFLFGDTPPLQTPYADGTLQIFTFQYISAAGGLLCISQALNIPHS